MSGVPRTARLLCVILRATALLPCAACGGRDAVEDAPALLGTGIPAAAANARGASIDPGGAAPAPVSAPVPVPLPEDHPLPPDPFGVPDPPPEKPAAGSAKPHGVQL